MRIRSIKPEFWRSDDIAALALPDRLLFIGLWSYVDDSGVGVDKLPHICADLFAADLERDPTEVYGRVRGGLQNLAERHLIVRYVEDGKSYLYITNWKNHQRIDKPSRARFPLPDAELLAIPATLPEPSATTPEKVAPGTEEQGNRGTEDSNTPSKPPASTPTVNLFDQFWEWYPRKVGKEAAKKAWNKARTKTDQQTILNGIERFRLDPNLPAKEFIPHPSTWLNEGRWEDEPLPPRGQQQIMRPTGSQVRLQAGYDLLQETRAELASQLEIEG
jgi:hypothetical protein